VYCSYKQEETTMEHTSTICNLTDKPKHPKYDFIHEIEKLATMKMSIWNAQHMDKKIDKRDATKSPIEDSNMPPKARYTIKTEYNRSRP
jgi:hypothetical protein